MAGLETLLQDLIEKLQLSDDHLDARVSDEHLSEASRITHDHETLGPELGLTPDEMTAISSAEQPQRLAVLRKWKQISAWKATYRKLIEALLKCGREDIAKKVGELLAQSENEESPSRMSSAQGILSGEQLPGQIVGIPEVSQPAVDQVEGENTTQLLLRVKGMELEFEDLLNATSEDLEERKVPIRKIRQSLFVHRASDTQTDIDIVAGLQHEIRKADTVDGLFVILSAGKCWDFLNPGLLLRIIDGHSLESMGIQHQKREYLEKLQHFRRTTTAQQFAKVCKVSTSDPKFSEVVFEMGKDWDSTTLEDVENFKQEIRGQRYLCKHMLNFRRSNN